MKRRLNRRLIPAGVCALLALCFLTGCFGSGKSRIGGREEYGLLSDGVLHVAHAVYPPFVQWKDEEETELTGFDVDLAAALAEALGVEVRVTPVARDELFDGLDADQYDCVLSAVAVHEERAARVDFSAPYYEYRQVIVIRSGAYPVGGPEDLDGLTVGYMEGSSESEDILSGLSCTTVQYGPIYDGLDDLRLGRLDAVVCAGALADGYMRRRPNVLEIAWTRPAEEGGGPEQIAVAVKRGNTKLVTAVNDALRQLWEAETLPDIRRRWLGR
ncbi:MAG: ABC transporter substrate-binding protein [Oscillospiraceae bacterium]|nr:ABC transporter substrate-binding protein [Oscillospiraceae bacterium]